ncbi:Putative lumazine-binding [Aquimarina amphilecti]|uniref:Putative lumazine-binding n=1 Tax=Aquimarina amphilecti TaxID=1038014 RepID=A0A1H7QJU0_AQUAM|nr:nuclear transport factor 2 family protein [Aquimarina amphilecti]SEL48242.1 Putative lumazine-binding [Aquimarina amphilecti]
MKKIFFVFTLITIFMTQVQAQNNDLQLIEKTINYYLDGMTTHNASSFEKAFHPNATMKWVEKKYEDVNAIEALSEYVNANDPIKTKTSIMAINIAGDAANAQLELEYDTFSYIDFMHLLKIDGNWKIVSKTYSTKVKSTKE